MKEGNLVRSFRKNFVNLGWKDPKEDRYFIAIEKIFLSEKVRYVSQINFVPRCSIFMPGIIIKRKKSMESGMYRIVLPPIFLDNFSYQFS